MLSKESHGGIILKKVATNFKRRRRIQRSNAAAADAVVDIQISLGQIIWFCLMMSGAYCHQVDYSDLLDNIHQVPELYNQRQCCL